MEPQSDHATLAKSLSFLPLSLILFSVRCREAELLCLKNVLTHVGGKNPQKGPTSGMASWRALRTLLGFAPWS